MRKLFLLLSLFAATTVAVAQPATTPSTPDAAPAPTGELPYEELMQKGENFLIPNENKVVFEGAAILMFYRASRVASDDGKKLEALLRAGHGEELMKQFPSAIETYSAALALPNISAAQKTRAQFARTNAKYQSARQDVLLPSTSDELRAAFEALLATPDLPPDSRLKAHEAIAELHTHRVRYLDAALEYQKILALPNLPKKSQADYISRALGELGKAATGATTLALLNSFNAQYLPLLETPEERAKAKDNWANALERQGDSQAAIRQWSEIADDSQMPLAQRVLALRAISHVQIYAKNYPAALAAADRMTELDSSPQTRFYQGEKRAAIFEAQKNEAQVRTQWQAFTAAPGISVENRAFAWNAIARSFKRERATTPQNVNAPQLIEGEKKALEAVWQTDGANLQMRKDALIARAQLEMDAQNFAAASVVLVDGLNIAETWKEPAGEVARIRRELYLILAIIAGAEKQYAKVVTALIGARQNSPWDDQYPGQAAISAFRDSMAAKDWAAARVVLLALRNVWGATPKSYLFNLAQVEIAAQDWNAAKKALDEFDAQNPTAEEKAEADKLRAQIPATP